MASEAEVKFYIERRNRLKEILDKLYQDDEDRLYFKLLDSSKNGAD